MNWTKRDLARLSSLVGLEPRKRLSVMNKWELRYAGELEVQRVCGLIDCWEFEPRKLRLAPRTYYTPDFLVVRNGEMEYHEVKGWLRDDASVKFKVAAEMYPACTFIMVRKAKRSESGNWIEMRRIERKNK
jgi:hypothetical protein